MSYVDLLHLQHRRYRCPGHGARQPRIEGCGIAGCDAAHLDLPRGSDADAGELGVPEVKRAR